MLVIFEKKKKEMKSERFTTFSKHNICFLIFGRK